MALRFSSYDFFGKSDKSKGKFFSDGGPTFFMSMNKRSSGLINPAYVGQEADDDEKVDHEQEQQIDDRDDSSAGSLRERESLSTNSGSSNESEPPPDVEVPFPEQLVPNGGPRVRVSLDALRESDHPPPYQAERKYSENQSNEKKWDIFRSLAKEGATSDEEIKFWKKIFVVTKLILCILLFVLVLGTAVISKLCFIIVTSNIHIHAPYDNSHSSATSPRHLLRSAHGALEFPEHTGYPSRTNVLWIWSLILIMGAPYVFIAGKCTWRLFFQMSKHKSLTLSTLIPVILMETLHSIGLMVIVFLIVPSFDPISGLLYTLNIAVIPGVLKIWFPRTKKLRREKVSNEDEAGSCVTRSVVAVLSFVAAVGQIGAIGLWTYRVIDAEGIFPDRIPLVVCLICGPIFVSATWLENYVHQGKRGSSGLPLFVRNVRQRKSKLLLITSLWKLVLLIVIPIAVFGTTCNEKGTLCIKALYTATDKAVKLDSNILSTDLNIDKMFGKDGKCNSHLPLIVASVSILSSIVCFKTAKVACKIMAQVADFSLPLVLSTPATVGLILGMYSGFLTSGDDCSIPFPLWDSTVTQYFVGVSNHWENLLPIIAGLTGFLSFLLITNHVWLPGKTRLQRTEILFMKPLYCGILTDQSLLLNRRRIEAEVDASDHSVKKSTSLPLPEVVEYDVSSNKSEFKTDDTPMIYMCATMWHENENEMTQLLKSIFRMDEDQCIRKNYQVLFKRRDKDYYEFEAHIFFDDAFEAHKDTEYDFTVNSFVKELIKTVRVSASAVMGITYKMPNPKKVATPYGGRLIWTLPGGNQLIAHLKDKAIIRHRKRWSQVMYMYYFLGFKLLNEGLSRKKLEKRAKNTFLLALDGDVDFHPPAVQLLVDRMKKNQLVGAACGRIHPIGNGAMVWYQKFEYAVSHWLQKAAEDKIGCVLCSPGCFSLFRGSALMDDNVMNRYTTPPTEPRHYVQYDQGEDRWLCTLLLQQGHRVEYCAASDALTYAPEGFYEFFNQRRRWTPSTLANIMDLLTDWKNVTRRNPEISVFYVFYQGLLLVSSILTPGTIFLLILGAINLAYPAIDLWVALIVNIIPIAVMVTLCFISTAQVQLSYAGILSTAYSLVMMIVLVGLLRQAADFGFCSVTTVFLLFVAGVFVMSAFLHPQEFWCLLHGCLYFLAIPAMSMVLMLYSLGNLHVVSWGTRENKQPVGDPKKQQKPQDRVLTWLEKTFSCCRGSEKRSEETTLRMILDRLDAIEDNISTVGSERTGHLSREAIFGRRSRSMSPMLMSGERSRSRSPAVMMPSESNPYSAVSNAFVGSGIRTNTLYEEEQQTPRDMLNDPYWMSDDEVIMRFKQDQPLSDDEVTFWRELIETYLKPLEGDEQKQKQIQEELIELRNKVCLIFILINSLFIIIVFSLQQVTADGGDLSVKLPCAEDKKDAIAQSIEPISVAFTLVFGILLLVQFLCMLTHRFATLLHICASTTIFKEKKLQTKIKRDPESGLDESKTEEKAISFEEGYELVKQMQSNQDDDSISVASDISYTASESELGDFDDDIAERKNGEDRRAVRQRWRRLASRRKELGKHGNSLNANFRRHFQEFQEMMKEEVASSNESAVGGPDEEKEMDTVIGSFQKKPAFKFFNRKSLHTMALIKQNPSLKESIAKTKLIRNRWQKVLTHLPDTPGEKPSMHRAVRALLAKSRLAEAEQNMTDNATCDSPPNNTPVTNRKHPVEIHNKADSVTDQGELESTTSTSKANGDEPEFSLQVPEVENDHWPEEDAYAALEDADTLF